LVSEICARDSLTDGSIDEAQGEREKDELGVPDVVARHRRDAEEHEDDGLGGRRQHLHHVADRRLRVGGDVRFHVLAHRYAASRAPVTHTHTHTHDRRF